MADGSVGPLTRDAAWKLVGGLSTPGKMPGYGYGLPAKECKVGSALRTIPNSVCSSCYALKGRYVFSNVQACLYRRLESLKNPRWVEAMTTLLHHLDNRHFRWHDSGDIQTPKHLAMIAQVATNCPDVKFWLPTREKVFVYSHLKLLGAFPKNLCVRVSGAMIDGPPPEGFPNTSTVSTNDALVTCPARQQNNQCGACRACWDTKVKDVVYYKH